MKEFHILPNDPRLLTLFQEQVDFILLSMQRDAQEEEASLKGKTLSADIVDANYDKIDKAERDEDWDIMEPGQDANDIYEQVKELTKAVNPEFEKENSNRLHVEKSKVKDKLRNKNEIIQEQNKIIEKARKRASMMKPNHNSSKVISNDDMDLDSKNIKGM